MNVVWHSRTHQPKGPALEELALPGRLALQILDRCEPESGGVDHRGATADTGPTALERVPSVAITVDRTSVL